MFMEVQVWSIWKKKKFDTEESRIRTQDSDGPVF